MPRFIFLVKATPMTEYLPGAPTPPADIYERMAAFNAELQGAGAFVDAGGFLPTKDGYKVTFDGGAATSTQGPFDVTAESTVSGFWIIKADNAEAALVWAKKVPFGQGEVSVRELREA